MFARFRQTPRRLQVSIVATRRDGGKVRHEHIASLGSVDGQLSVADRVAFWKRVHDRLARLSNRIDPAMQGRLLGELHARIPMPTVDEQNSLKLENAKADERFWSGLHDMHESTAIKQKDLIAATEKAAADNRAGASRAGDRAATAKDRRERLEKGEDVAGGLGKPVDCIAIFREAGWTTKDLRKMQEVAKLNPSDDEITMIANESVKAGDRAAQALIRKMLRQRGGVA